MDLLYKQFFSGFLHKELPAFGSLLDLHLPNAEQWKQDFAELLRKLTSMHDEQDFGETYQTALAEFREREALFYKTVLDDSFARAFAPSPDPAMQNACFECLQNIVRRALCMDSFGPKTHWTPAERYHSRQLRSIKNNQILDLSDCEEAIKDLWNYLQEPASVTRNGQEISVKRMFSFQRTGKHMLLINCMTIDSFTYTSWLKYVLINHAEKTVKYEFQKELEKKGPVTIISTDDDSGDEAEARNVRLQMDMFRLQEKKERAHNVLEKPFVAKSCLAAHIAYYRFLISVFCNDSARSYVKQFETWLLRTGLSQMMEGQEHNYDISIDETSAILACLTHDEDWKQGQKAIQMGDKTIWANPDVWTDGKASNRPRFNSLVDSAVKNIYKLNALVVNRIQAEKKSTSTLSIDYFQRLLAYAADFSEKSTSELAKAFQKAAEVDAAQDVPLMKLMAQTKEDEEVLDVFLLKHIKRDFLDFIDDYFRQPYDCRTTTAPVCCYLKDVPVLSEEVRTMLQIG